MSTSSPKPGFRSRVAINLLIAIGYYILAELSRNLASTPNSVTPVWPPDGFAVGLTLIYGNIGLPGVCLGSFFANIGAFGESQTVFALLTSFFSVLGLALGTTLGTWLCSSLLKRLTQHQYPFSRVPHTLTFLACAAIGPIANATFGITMLALNQQVSWNHYGSAWLTWWISNVAGILILTPALLSGYHWYQQQSHSTASSHSSGHAYSPWTTTAAPRWIEGAIVVGLLSWIAQLSFWGQQPLAYALVPLLVWVAFRFGQFGATLGVMWTAALAILGTIQGLGTFAQDNLNQALLGLQCFIGVIGFTILILMAVLEERRTTAARLRETIHALKQANQELAGYTAELDQAAQLKDEFLSTISHELRTPLVGILGTTELLQRDPVKKVHSDQLDAIQTIDRSGQHLLSLIDEILDFNNIEAGRLSLSPKTIEVQPLCQATLEIIAPVAAQKEITLTEHIAPQLKAIQIDEKRIQQVLINLLSNAVKYTPPGGRVSLEVKQLGQNQANPDALQFSIQDTGIGIPEAKLEHIFERFFQVDSQRNRKNEGLGLGLAIAKQLVESHQGHLDVSSRVGQGSCFKVELPYSNSSLQKQSSSHALSLKASNSSYILLAEDDQISQTILKRHLERHHYQVAITQNGQEAINHAKQNIPTLILMDIQMPVMDGIEAISILRKDSRFQSVPIVVLTALPQTENQRRCFQAGATDYLTKPIKLDRLLAVVQSHYPQKLSLKN